jgi:hypothetical protein
MAAGEETDGDNDEDGNQGRLQTDTVHTLWQKLSL